MLQQAYVGSKLVTVSHRVPRPLTLEEMGIIADKLPENVCQVSGMAKCGVFSVGVSNAAYNNETRWA